MNNHGLGHLPQPDNFTTVGNKLGIEINQYNCPINVVIEMFYFSTIMIIFVGLQWKLNRRDERTEGEGRRGQYGNDRLFWNIQKNVIFMCYNF